MNSSKDSQLKKMIDNEIKYIEEEKAVKTANEIYDLYTKLVEKIESKMYQNSPKIKAQVYVSFAYFLFSVAEYDYFFEMLIQAQNYGYPKDEIEELLWSALIEPNLPEFKEIYNANLQMLESHSYIDSEKIPAFEDLPFWLLPNGNQNEYYMYHKKTKKIQDKIILYQYKSISFVPTTDMLADYLIVENWNWANVFSYGHYAKKMRKESYIVINDILKSFSCLQGTLLTSSMLSHMFFFNTLAELETYIEHSNLSLPRNIINIDTPINSIQKVLDGIHKKRLIKEYRTGDRILLSVCIPSFNRGNRAYQNILSLLETYYDEEIEFIISNNGTQNETKSYYDRISKIDDARLTYFAYEENQGFAINCCKVCELAKGEYIMLLSDEDLIRFENLDKVMNNLYNAKDQLSIMRTSTSSQFNLVNVQANAGKEALGKFMLTSNYMSGFIMKNELLKKHKGIEYVKEHLSTNSACFFYPHMFWEILLCQYGAVRSTNLCLIEEGEAEKTEVPEVQVDGGEVRIPYYATFEGRLEQHKGFAHIFKDLEITKIDVKFFRHMYLMLSNKTLFLITISINTFYKKTDIDVARLYEDMYNALINEDLYNEILGPNNSGYKEDLKIIKQKYIQIKNQLNLNE
ncbi:hypothetical protein PTI45_01057 [Paenibacillus nuruki]|uniref:Glycosyltransferase 2-like domain-containing protein n=1 Tax=Paenibacillus nuruki TaxID=1886670 RepID=A0A1E3L7E6_9BACL|nr:glycosyltransferase [Paenibacillus nuruki]ODP29574.1 hypothetical protein PTI45_01057 [Paenibacillus nuruki]